MMYQQIHKRLFIFILYNFLCFPIFQTLLYTYTYYYYTQFNTCLRYVKQLIKYCYTAATATVKFPQLLEDSYQPQISNKNHALVGVCFTLFIGGGFRHVQHVRPQKGAPRRGAANFLHAGNSGRYPSERVK